MSAAFTLERTPAALAFDHLADVYDDLFTQSAIGRAQRDVVWEQAARTFTAGDHVLELNCGTGEDALFLAGLGISVVACDISEEMVRRARIRRHREAPRSAISFQVMATKDLPGRPARFDGVFSNFSGLNCVADLGAVARQLAQAVRPGAPLLLCFSTRYCVWEMLRFLAHGKFREAFRRCAGRAIVRFDELAVAVQYPTVRQLRWLFSPAFVLCSCTGVGISVPPSYMEPWVREYPGILRGLRRLDRVLCHLPWFRAIGDHVLVRFERVSP